MKSKLGSRINTVGRLMLSAFVVLPAVVIEVVVEGIDCYLCRMVDFVS